MSIKSSFLYLNKPIEWYQLTCLFDDKDGVLHLLPLQIKMHVRHEHEQMAFTISIRNDDCDFIPRSAVDRTVMSANFQSGLFQIQFQLRIAIF